MEKEHGDESDEVRMDWKMVWGFRVTEEFRNDAMLRQVTEGMNIEYENQSELLNERFEWRDNIMVRVGRIER